jgi:hypothetical protein
VFLNIFLVEEFWNNCSYSEEPLPMKTNVCNCRTRIIPVFWCVFILFAIFQNSFVFIPLFLSELLKMFCRNLWFRGPLFEKLWLSVIELGFIQVRVEISGCLCKQTSDFIKFGKFLNWMTTDFKKKKGLFVELVRLYFTVCSQTR